MVQGQLCKIKRNIYMSIKSRVKNEFHYAIART